ncbi:hypothetical protein JCM19037_4784 [Geomicrobium sp. JCM 19037]|uniref:hypothetical protein n=1 Tax=unclassified Geomicrobium TaxID=2628951 RepID=UPI00045F1FEF|nr:hypothetical protein [Geomicrobium sp. JCM 19037]GAK06204.1 hypothetical protein JCM19037_4784 [Geomicrobium sp. JCM 19037]
MVEWVRSLPRSFYLTIIIAISVFILAMLMVTILTGDILWVSITSMVLVPMQLICLWIINFVINNKSS